MLLKLAALGAIGYAGYKYLEKNGKLSSDSGSGSNFGRQGASGSEPNMSDPQVALAGGPLSEQARVVESGRSLPS